MKPTVKAEELNKPKVDLDYTKTRSKSIRRYGKNEKGMKVVISQAEIIPLAPPRTGNIAPKIRFTKKQFKARMKSKAARQARKINRKSFVKQGFAEAQS